MTFMVNYMVYSKVFLNKYMEVSNPCEMISLLTSKLKLPNPEYTSKEIIHNNIKTYFKLGFMLLSKSMMKFLELEHSKKKIVQKVT